MSETKLQKVGVVKVPDGKYIDKNGIEKTRFHEIGVVFATPHHTNMRIKFHANGFGEGQFASIFYDDDKKPNFSEAPNQTASDLSQNLGFSPEEIPF